MASGADGYAAIARVGAAKDPQLAVAAMRSANTHFHLALVQRPASPFAWASLALTKLYLGEQDDELLQALQRAEELGPWSPRCSKRWSSSASRCGTG